MLGQETRDSISVFAAIKLPPQPFPLPTPLLPCHPQKAPTATLPALTQHLALIVFHAEPLLICADGPEILHIAAESLLQHHNHTYSSTLGVLPP